MLLLASLGIGLWLVLTMPLFAQESYYWCYAQHPALSYFDHPPMVAWLIWLGTQGFGDGRLGIRLGAWLCGAGTVWAGLRLLREFGAPAAARSCWLLLSISVPIAVGVRFLANPDPALGCFTLLTVLALWRARGGGLRWWLLAGLCAGCALLSKYTAAFLAAGGAIVLLVDPALRRQLRGPGPYAAVAVAALTFLPVIWWNVANHFESFRFQTAGRWSHAQLSARWVGEFVFGQVLVLHPVVAAGLPLVAVWLWRRGRRGDQPAVWLLAFSVPLAAWLVLSSLLIQVKVNWLVPAALPLLIGTARWWSESGFRTQHPVASRRLARAVVVLGPLLCLGPIVALVPQTQGSSWSGWDEIAATAERWEEQIDTADGVEGNVFFFAGNYRDAAQLTHALRVRSGATLPADLVEPTLAENVLGRPALQFDHWSAPAAHVGQDAIFVLSRPERRQKLVDEVRPHFAAIERVDHLEIERLGIRLTTADVYVCRSYWGPRP